VAPSRKHAGRVVPALVPALLVGLLLAGCGGGSEDRSASEHPTKTPVALGGGCLTADDATLSWYDDESLSAAVGILGSGPQGVVISYEKAGSVCPWLPLADRLTAEGVTVLLYERLDDFDPSAYLPAMLTLLTDQGVDRIALVGGSVGGMASITVAATGDPAIASVVSLSGASQDTIAAAPLLDVPLLQVVARDDQPFAAAAKATEQAASVSPQHRLVVVEGSAHASSMFAVDATVLDRVAGFVIATTER
jgi:pimeloyl-ACP methyl ester carboxylesterase